MACSGETGSLQTGSSFAAADSAFYLEAYLDIRTLNRVTRGRSDLGGGGGFGLQIKAPFSKTLGPPLHHLFFLNFAGYSYTKLAIIDPQPTLNTVALGYGLQVFPTNSIRIGRAVTPFAQITGSGVLVYSDRIADEQGTIANAKTNVRLQYEVGGGIAGDVRRFASFYAGVFYHNLDNVNYYRVTTAGTETTIDTKKTDLQGINIRFGVSLRLVGLVGE